MTLRFAGLGLLLFAVSVSAHHSRREFAPDSIEIQGELLRATWRNPHPELTILVESAEGDAETWHAQVFGSIQTLSRAGVTAESIREGQRVRLLGRPSTARPNYILGTNLLFPDGFEVVLHRRMSPVWSDYFIGGSEAYAEEGARLVDAQAENRGVFRVWHMRAGTWNNNYPFRDSALAASAQVNPLDDWIERCETPGMPVPMLQPAPFELVDQGDTYLLRNYYFDVDRTIHMDSAADSSSQPYSPLGYSVGRWDGNTLVIETDRINWPYFNSRSVPQSQQIHVTERYTLSDDQSQLDALITVVDPTIFTGPATLEKGFAALDLPLPEWECFLFER